MITLAAFLLLQSSAVISPAPADSAQFRTRDAAPFPLGLLEMPAAQEWWTRDLPHVRFAPTLSRYNRIEGLSLAVVGGWQAGASDNGRLAALVRLGVADLVPNGEVELSRTSGFARRSASVYYRLGVSNDWGNPLALGASLGALVIGRDEGFYYRSAGASLSILDSTDSHLQARVFLERHRSARVKNNFSFADVFGDRDFRPNIVADDADLLGVKALWSAQSGELATDPRLFTEAKVEFATGDFDYARAMFEGTASRPLGSTLMVSFTASAGISGGTLPIQRNWFLGGSRSLRGQRAGVMVGNSFWMTQAEIGTINVFARPAIFFDAGWAGNRDDFSSPGRIGTGAGIGGSFFDGSLRFDLARGIYPGTGWRGALYLQARM